MAITSMEQADNIFSSFPEASVTDLLCLSNGADILDSTNEHDISADNDIVVLEQRLQKATFNDEFEAHHMYCLYAHAKGFSVRKGKHEYFSGTTQMRAKLFTCAKEGLKELEVGKTGNGLYKKSNVRTGCPARIWFTRVKDGNFRVTKWVKEHNHEMAALEDRHLLRSARSIDPIRGNLIESHVKAGLRPIDSFNMILEDCGGAENVGYTAKDVYNFVNQMKMSKIEAGDAQSVINHFKKKINHEGLFYWDVQLDVEGRVANIFWRDSRARIDYEFFGDVVTFDTTYRTNKYGLICAPFVGVNHHNQNVMFACGFLSDETSATFKWLFETFLDCMGGKQPKTLFTDQDAAMLNAIPQVFPQSRHRLCQWHISQNAPSHLASLRCQDGFMPLFKKCMNGCDTEEEFEHTWLTMMRKYDAFDNSWLKNMHKLRHKWSSAFSKDTFCAGLQATSRSESTNRALNGIANKTTCLYAFVESFEKLVDGWRRKERDEDNACNQGLPTIAIRNSEILIDASKKYTRKVYRYFEEEFQGVGASYLVSKNQISDYVCCYEVELQGKSKLTKVIFDASSMEIKCICSNFETRGILCTHALKVLNFENVRIIPEKYFLKRWCRDARDRVKHSHTPMSIASESEMVYSNRLMRSAHDLVMKSKGSGEARLIVEKAIESAYESLKLLSLDGKLNCQASVDGVNAPSQEDENDCRVLDPLFVRSKGISKTRIPSHWDRQKKRAQKVAASSNAEKRGRKKTPPTQECSGSTPMVLQDVSNIIPPSYLMHSQESIVPPMPAHGIAPNFAFGGIPFGGAMIGYHYAREDNPSI